MNETGQKISDEAVVYLKANQKSIISKFADLEVYPSDERPVSVFMAGSPGAGKTEFSKRLIEDLGRKIVRIDADDVRELLPQYKKNNSDIVQGAASLGVEKIYDHVLHNNQNFVLDGTFNNYSKATSNISRSLDKSRKVEIFYIYQDPKIAWDFTKKREAVEGRTVPRSVFIESFILARENVQKIKDLHGDRIELNVVIKDYSNSTEKVLPNVSNIDDKIVMKYTIDELEKLIK